MIFLLFFSIFFFQDILSTSAFPSIANNAALIAKTHLRLYNQHHPDNKDFIQAYTSASTDTSIFTSSCLHTTQYGTVVPNKQICKWIRPRVQDQDRKLPLSSSIFSVVFFRRKQLAIVAYYSKVIHLCNDIKYLCVI